MCRKAAQITQREAQGRLTRAASALIVNASEQGLTFTASLPAFASTEPSAPTTSAPANSNVAFLGLSLAPDQAKAGQWILFVLALVLAIAVIIISIKMFKRK